MQGILEKETATEIILTPKGLLKHWQGHRGLTRRLIEAFPEKELFTYSIGGMRSFAELVSEMLDMAVPGVSGVVTGKWQGMEELSHVKGTGNENSKEDLLRRWDAATEEMNRLWTLIPAGRFTEKDVAFGQYEGTIISFILYFIDNEIHHRGQGYVYLRSLGIEPPPFWDRA
ncbi:MAG TPA: DinB family protein [Chitinophagaceae bacterium]|nr:DinB family protein [Chitinophagaceae bacterium]